MPRKTDGTTTSRTKKGAIPAETAAVQPATARVPAEIRSPEARSADLRSTEIRDNVTPINVAPIKAVAKKTSPSPASPDQVSLDDEIRRRAYELFLERNGVAADPAGDWFVAEREVRARHAGKGSAFAAKQGS